MRVVTLTPLFIMAACWQVRVDRIDSSCCVEHDVRVGWTTHQACDDIAYRAMSPDGECFWFSCDNAPDDFARGNCMDACEDTGHWDLPDCD